MIHYKYRMGADFSDNDGKGFEIDPQAAKKDGKYCYFDNCIHLNILEEKCEHGGIMLNVEAAPYQDMSYEDMLGVFRALFFRFSEKADVPKNLKETFFKLSKLILLEEDIGEINEVTK